MDTAATPFKVQTLSPEDIGKRVYKLDLYTGEIDAYALIGIDNQEGGEYLIFSNTNELYPDDKEYVLRNWKHYGGFLSFNVYESVEAAFSVLEKERIRIEKEIDTAEKLLQYIFTHGIYPFLEKSYHDIIGDDGFSEFEFGIIRNRIKELFDVELEFPAEQ